MRRSATSRHPRDKFSIYSCVTKRLRSTIVKCSSPLPSSPSALFYVPKPWTWSKHGAYNFMSASCVVSAIILYITFWICKIIWFYFHYKKYAESVFRLSCYLKDPLYACMFLISLTRHAYLDAERRRSTYRHNRF